MGALVLTTLVAGPAAATTSTTVTIDQRGKVLTLPSDIVEQVQRRCASTDAVMVKVLEPTATLTQDVVCSAASNDPDRFVVRPLLAKAAHVDDAGKRADAVIATQDRLPPIEGLTYGRDSLVWSFAMGEGLGCIRASSPRQIQRMMNDSIQNHDPSPEHWTVIEAVRLVGECPERLPDLYRNVAALGNPSAAAAVRELLDRRTVTMPLSSVPHGVSARMVEQRPVFLRRVGDRVSTFLTDVHHLPGDRTLWWCPTDEMFTSPAHGEMFASDGTVIAGPAERGLDRFRTTVSGGMVTVHLHDLLDGSTRRSDRPRPPAADSDVATWNTSPRSFCFEAVTTG
jgi:nitrite reductase/ring-hydroxylating ferredoxin subunit